jgi:hypothetical protein
MWTLLQTARITTHPQRQMLAEAATTSWVTLSALGDHIGLAAPLCKPQKLQYFTVVAIVD